MGWISAAKADREERAQALNQELIIVYAHYDIAGDIVHRRKRGERGVLSGHWGQKLQAGGANVQLLPLLVEDEFLPGLGLRKLLEAAEALLSDGWEKRMIKLTVMYNLPPGADHEDFIRWRTTEHQAENMSIPGIIKSDFYVVKEAWNLEELPYRYITEAYFPDMKTFQDSFFDPEYQKKLTESLKLISDPLFLISEEVINQSADE